MSIIIKRYQNRKLYNTQTKRYITLDEIERLIKDEYDLKIIDNQTGRDITAITLSQVIFELQKNQVGSLPIKLLSSLVRSRGKKIEDIRRNIFESLNLQHHFDVEIERRINLLVEQGELTQALSDSLLNKLLGVSSDRSDYREDLENHLMEYLQVTQFPKKSEVHALIQRIDELSHRVDEYNIQGDISD